MSRTIPWVAVLLVIGLARAKDAPDVRPGARASALAEYQALRGRIPDTAYAHHQLGLWCRENGLDTEAAVQARLQAEAHSIWPRSWTARRWSGVGPVAKVFQMAGTA